MQAAAAFGLTAPPGRTLNFRSQHVTFNLLTHSAAKFSTVNNISMVVGSANDNLTADNSASVTLVGGQERHAVRRVGPTCCWAGRQRCLTAGGDWWAAAEPFDRRRINDYILIGGVLAHYNEAPESSTRLLERVSAEWMNRRKLWPAPSNSPRAAPERSKVFNTTTIRRGRHISPGGQRPGQFFVFARPG